MVINKRDTVVWRNMVIGWVLKGDPVRDYCGCWDLILLLSRGVFRLRDLIAGEKKNVPFRSYYW
jgi:hypothetical protein